MSGERILLGIKDKAPKSSIPKASANDTKSSGKVKVGSAKRGTKRKKDVKDHSPEHLGRLEKLRATYKAKKEAKEAEEAEERNRQYLIVSIDLGCTYTGIAFIATIHQRPQVQVMNEWPNGDRMAKVATRIAYADENGTLQENAYGYKVSPGLKSYSWFKLHFDRNTPETEFDDPRLRQSSGLGIGKLPPGKSVVDINADFLSFVYDQAFKFLSSRMGEIMVQETPMKFFLTTPALWSFEARAKTREAATRAGFGMRRNSARVEDQLYVIDEPEAAAIAAIKTTIDQLPGANPFEDDQGIIVADLGGGTADLVSYRIVTVDPLQLDEICVGIGGKCGGSSIDRALHILMEERYGEAFSSLPYTKTGPGSSFMDAFEKWKRIFTTDDNTRTWELQLKMSDLDPEVEGYDFEEGMVVLSCDDMERLFDVAVTKSLDLVTEQIRLIRKRKATSVDLIILCGGLGSSPYVKKRFEDFCQDDLGGKVTVVQPLEPWSAVCRGAALRGLEKYPVVSRRSRAYYGFAAHEEFNTEKHDEADAFWDLEFGKRAKDQMFWPIKRHEKLKHNTVKIRKCRYTVPPNVIEFTGEECLYQCDNDSQPLKLNDESVRHAGTIFIKLTDFLKEERKKATKNGTFDPKTKPTVIEVDLVFIVGSEKGILDISARSGKRVVGTATIHWEPNSVWERESG